MIKTTIQIKGMHCKSCELLIGDNLKEIAGVKKVKVSLKTKTAEIYSKNSLDHNRLTAAVETAGYQIGIDNRSNWLSHDPADYKDLGLALLAFLLLYYLLSLFGFGNLNLAGSSSPSSLLVVLIVGLTAGISTCMAVVGGLVLGISARYAETHPEATTAQKFKPHLYFNLGRIVSYFLLGGLIGLLGKIFQFSSTVLGLLTIIIGLVMLLLGLKLIEIFPRLSDTSITLPSRLSGWLGLKKHPDKEYSHQNAIIAGALTFFLPCGFTQAMQLYAMGTGNFLSGALIMGIFAIGTAPGLLGIGGLTSLVKGRLSKLFYKLAGLVVIALALFNLSNGYNLTGWTFQWPTGQTPQSNTTTDTSATNITIENGIQIARMEQGLFGFSPSHFIVQKNLPVRWIITATNLNSCSSSLVLPKLNISKNFTAGENIIEFTPTESGTLKFTCGMGMYPGSFTVI